MTERINPFDSPGENVVNYGETPLEKDAKDLKISREIVQKIMDFGVSQKQILRIIRGLALNLENNDHMKKVSVLAKECLEESDSNSIESLSNKVE